MFPFGPSQVTDSSRNSERDIPGRIFLSLKKDLSPEVIGDFTFELDLLTESGEIRADLRECRIINNLIEARSRRREDGRAENSATAIDISYSGDARIVIDKQLYADSPDDALKRLLETLNLQCRVHICFCHGYKALSVTARVSRDAAIKDVKDRVTAFLQGPDRRLLVERDQLSKRGQALLGYLLEYDQAAFDRSDFKGSRKAKEELPISIETIVGSLHEQIFFPATQPDRPGGDITKKNPSNDAPESDCLHGAILIAGRTKSAKSLIARGLIHKFISHKPTYTSLTNLHDRRPHLVTCEDPIEGEFRERVSQLTDWPAVIDYTPRDRVAGDYSTLQEAFNDALRQTPACFFVGETRDEKDLKTLLHFAGTGHLVVTTTHAGSLTDLFTKVFQATNSRTAADRGLVGQRILAVVHLQQVTVGGTAKYPKRFDVVLPTLWRRSATSTAALVSAGIGSLTPQSASRGGDRPYDCLGRQFFAAEFARDAGMSDHARTPLLEEARNLDLQGR